MADLAPQRCHFCDAPAVAYCDFIDLPVRPLLSCNRPICNEHRRVVGHICDRSSRTKNNESDTIDHCTEHPDCLHDMPLTWTDVVIIARLALEPLGACVLIFAASFAMGYLWRRREERREADREKRRSTSTLTSRSTF